MTKPFVDLDASDFVNDTNFKKFVELFFGEGTKTTFRKEWAEFYGDEPVSKILLIHVPHLAHQQLEASDRLTKFWELMSEMKDYPINLIIDINFLSQEEYLVNETNQEETKVTV